MTTPTNWPNPDLPGFPLFPERDGWHWISYCGTPRPLFWSAKSNTWFSSSGTRSRRESINAHWEYISPILTPAQISEMLAGERERCAKACEHLKPSMDEVISNSFFGVRGVALVDAALAIRNLGAAP